MEVVHFFSQDFRGETNNLISVNYGMNGCILADI